MRNRQVADSAGKLDMEYSKTMVNSSEYYSEYHGHLSSDNEKVFEHFMAMKRQKKLDGLIYLAGDSSLDNKFWFKNTAKACNGLEEILSPPISVKDIAYWLNKLEESSVGSKGSDARRYATINCAVEESTIGDRSWSRLLSQDRFIKDHITSDDTLVVSIGGNDIALRPSPCTIMNMLCLAKCTPHWLLNKCACGTALPCDDRCFGCTTSCLSDLFAWPFGIGYFIHLFKTRIQTYIENLISSPSFLSSCGLSSPPPPRVKRVLVCMIYYPDETSNNSWADGTLGALGYNHNPAQLQLLIRKIFLLATRSISIPGVDVVAVPLFAALDGQNTTDYSQRVEPSATGGMKMAQLILQAVHDRSTTSQAMSEAYEAHEKQLLLKNSNHCAAMRCSTASSSIADIRNVTPVVQEPLIDRE